jgi:3-phenylpropionate/trans-cinnamate dioxygenase ferredoxin subunit
MPYRALEKLINLHDGYRRVVTVDGRQLLLLQEQGTPRLVDRHCPHAGQIFDTARVEGDVLVCPLHQIRFSLADGSPTPALCKALSMHRLVYEGNSLGIDSGFNEPMADEEL